MLTPLQNSILLSLATYHFLTRSQMHLLQLGSMTALHRALRAWSQMSSCSSLVNIHSFPPSARWGRLEYVYSLTPAGYSAAKESAPDMMDEATQKEVLPIYPLDYFHRFHTISFRIGLENALKRSSFSLVKYDQYFEKIPQGQGASCIATQVSLTEQICFRPDSIFVLGNGRRQGVFSLETVWTPNLSRVLHHVRQHMDAISGGLVSSQYGLPRQDYRALFIVRDQTLSRGVLLRLEQMKVFTPFRHHFLFAPMAHMKHDVLRCWRKVGDQQHLFNFINGRTAYRLPTT